MKIKKYSMSFTSGALLHRESLLVLKLYLRLQDWNEVEKEILKMPYRTTKDNEKLSNKQTDKPGQTRKHWW